MLCGFPQRRLAVGAAHPAWDVSKSQSYGVFCTPALIKLTPVPVGTLNLPWVQRQLLWLLSMEVGADDVKSVLRLTSQRTFMLVLHKQNQKILGRRMFRMKKTKTVLKFWLTFLPGFDSLPVTMFS